FAPETMGKLKAASEAIKNERGVDRVVAMPVVADVVPGPAGAEIAQLVSKVPENEEEHQALRKKVLSREHIVGSLVSKDGRAALIMVFLAEGISDRQVTTQLRAVAERELKPLV